MIRFAPVVPSQSFTYKKGNAENFDYLITEDGVSLLKYTGEETEDVVIPAEIEGYSVVKINNPCFAGNETIKSVSFPGTISEIENFAFYQCSALEEIELNDGLLKIGDSAFRETALKKVDFPTSLRIIGDAAFMCCKELEDIQFHNNSVLRISMSSFYKTALKSVSLPSGTYKIESQAFSKCKQLKLLNIPENAEYVGSSVADYGVKITKF